MNLNQPARKKQNKSTRLPFTVIIKKAKKDTDWTLVIKDSHNHPQSFDPTAHAGHRRADIEAAQIPTTVVNISKNGINPKQIITTLIAEHSNTTFTPRDIYNQRAKGRRI